MDSCIGEVLETGVRKKGHEEDLAKEMELELLDVTLYSLRGK